MDDSRQNRPANVAVSSISSHVTSAVFRGATLHRGELPFRAVDTATRPADRRRRRWHAVRCWADDRLSFLPAARTGCESDTAEGRRTDGRPAAQGPSFGCPSSIVVNWSVARRGGASRLPECFFTPSSSAERREGRGGWVRSLTPPPRALTDK